MTLVLGGLSAVQVKRRDHRRWTRNMTAMVAALSLVAAAGGAAVADDLGFGNAQVGATNAGGILLPTNQRVDPIGTRDLVSNGRLLSSTISPDGTRVATLTWENFTGFLSIIDVRTGKVVQQIGTGATSDPRLGDGAVAADGPLYSADGKNLWFPQGADLIHFAVAADGTVSSPVIIPLYGPYGDALPSGMALSPDGSTLYVALNGNNTLGEIDTASNTLIRQIPVGNAPRQVVLVGDRAFVSNEGGHPAKPGEFTNESDGTAIVSNRTTGAATTGTVSVVNLATGVETSEIPVGLEPTAEYLAADGTLMVANTNQDSVSMIDTARAQVTQTFNTDPLPGSTVGSSPNDITMPDPNHILVSIGRDNALAVYRYNGRAAPIQYEGLLPTDWYPVKVAMDPAIGKVVVTNDKGIGARGGLSTINKGPDTAPQTGSATGHNTYDDTGSLTVFALPTEAQLATYTHQVFLDNGWEHLLSSTPLTGSTAAPVAVPARLGDPSPIKHIFLIVRENRTYDQVLGDIGRGNSNPANTQFGQTITPNAHALVNTFGLFDNFYDAGTLSADGHNWLMQANANDYIEKEFGAFYRSYPAQGGDALAYQRDGFLWNAAKQAGLTAQDFGEYNNYLNFTSGTPTWSQWYQDSQILEGKASGPLPVPESEAYTYADIPSLNAIDYHAYPRFDLDIPDQYRTDVWQQAFAQSQASGQLANLTIIWLPNDHTAGVGTGDPYPVAEVADNDLALGRMVDTISHSKFWGSSAIFVDEDDTQNGVDSVDGHRSPMMVISPYSNRHALNQTYYTQLNLVKTIEQILGIAPMNQEDRAAVPMTDAFTNTPNLTPYTVAPNQIPLTLGLTAPSQSSGSSAANAKLGTPGESASVPAPEQAIYQEWVAWSGSQHFGGKLPAADQANPEQLNRLDWYTSTGWTKAYPGDTSILGPAQVPGANLPADDLGDS